MRIKDFFILLAAVLVLGFLSGTGAMFFFWWIDLPECQHIPTNDEEDCKLECSDYAGRSVIYYECLSFCLAYDWDAIDKEEIADGN